METVFIYILKVNALLVLFYLVYQLALSRETFYKHSRWFLLSGLFVSLLLPFVTFTKIEYYEVRNSIDNQFFQAVSATNEVLQEPILTNQEILFLVYGIICLGFLIKTMFDFFKLFKIITVSNSEKKDKLVYINTNLVHTPFSFFNYIVFNEELINPVELQNIMKHEEAHSIQKHSFDTLLAQFFIILFWFNPIVWLYRKSIVQNLEFLADSFAIQQVSDRTVYQKTMLKITTQASNISIINTFNQSSIKKRIIMLNTNQSNQKNIWKFGIILPFVTAFMLLFQVETIAQEKQSKTIKKEIKKDVIVQEKEEIQQTKIEIEKAKPEIEIAKKEIEQVKIEIESAESYNERTRKEIELAKIEVKNEMKNATPEVKRARIEMERAKKDMEQAKLEMNLAKQDHDIAPAPQNGLQEFRKQIAMKFKLPEVKSDVNATVIVKFIVLKTGEISDITILKEDPKNLGLGDELTRILKESPNWKPGTKDGKPADLYFVLPVAIQIQSTK
jgi:hypothetical protein